MSATTDPKAVADRYLAAWNETDPARRRALLGAFWAADARFVDPIMSGDGPDGMDACIAGVHARFPGFRFALIGEPDGFGDHVRLSWGLGPAGGDAPVKGTDVLSLRDGRLARITGFFDQVPAPAPAEA
jgi:hypothetical protein